MTWFTEFNQVIHDAAHLGQLEHLQAAEAALHSGDPTRLREAFPGGVRIDDPRFGRVEGEAALIEFCKASGSWLREREGRAATDRGHQRARPGSSGSSISS